MNNAKTLPFEKISKSIPIGVHINSITVSKILNVVISFLIGQAFIFKTINPFVIPYLVVQINRKMNNYAVTLISAYLGVVFALLDIIDISEFLGLPYFQAYLTQYTVSFILILCSRIIFEKSKIRFTQKTKIFIGFVTSLASSLVILSFESFGAYYVMIGVYVALASLVIPVFIGEGAYILTLNIPKGKTKINDKELFSIGLLMTIILIGATRIGFLGFSLFLVILFIYILNLAYLFGGIVSGIITLVTVGLFAVLTANVDANIVLFITFATIFAGFMRKDKILVVVSFGLVLAISYFLNKMLFFDYNLVTISVSFILGAIMFLLSPEKFFRDVALVSEPTSSVTEEIGLWDYENYTKEFRVEKILEQKIASEKIETIVKGLSFDYSCQCNECISQKEKLNALKKLMLQTSRLVKENYTRFIDDFHSDIVFYKSLEQDILKSLKANKVFFIDIKIMKNKYEKYEIVIFSDIYPILNSQRTILNAILYEKLNKKFIQLPTISQTDKYTKIYFTEKYSYNFNYGIAMKTKNGDSLSGDSYSILDLENHCNIIALSDGMGAGKKANAVSSKVLDLLDDLLVSSVGTTDAINMINYIMLVNSKFEEFATLDVCEINKYTGECSIYKVGSAQTYILRNKKVKAVVSNSLPIGIIEDIEIKKFNFNVYSGDYIIMVTDGISEVEREVIEKDKWLIESIRDMNFRQPQDIADYIINKTNKIENNTPDDRTVLVCKVY